MVFSGHNLIAENGALLAESRPFESGYACTELDLGRLLSERCRNTSFEPMPDGYEVVSFSLPVKEVPLTRHFSPTPFVPADDTARAERCELILRMQSDGLAKRMEHAHVKTAVIGISGGLDSCLALLVAVHAMKKLGRPMDDILRHDALLRHDEAHALERGDPLSGARRAVSGNFDRQYRPQPFC